MTSLPTSCSPCRLMTSISGFWLMRTYSWALARASKPGPRVSSLGFCLTIRVPTSSKALNPVMPSAIALPPKISRSPTVLTAFNPSTVGNLELCSTTSDPLTLLRASAPASVCISSQNRTPMSPSTASRAPSPCRLGSPWLSTTRKWPATYVRLSSPSIAPRAGPLPSTTRWPSTERSASSPLRSGSPSLRAMLRAGARTSSTVSSPASEVRLSDVVDPSATLDGVQWGPFLVGNPGPRASAYGTWRTPPCAAARAPRACSPSGEFTARPSCHSSSKLKPGAGPSSPWLTKRTRSSGRGGGAPGGPTTGTRASRSQGALGSSSAWNRSSSACPME
mmetsp:Transcript_30406/g.85098  ORF Transcript_30406/g.85098 Transcript_30406/m.85098 type:complete len:335 (+) Transcript_30406:1596-2600(+)